MANTILVTGGSGFIGSNFIDYVLEHTDDVVLNLDVGTYAGKMYDRPDSDRYKYFSSNIASVRARNLNVHGVTHVINFAAETHVDRSISGPEAFIQTNVVATFHFIEALRQYYEMRPDLRIVHISTDEVFGSLGIDDPSFTENSQYKPNSPYSATKAASDHLFRAWHETYGLPVIITNTCNNFGPRQFPEKFIPVVIDKILNNDYIPVYGNGGNIREWLYVIDHCRALYNILMNGTIGDRYNIGSKQECMNLHLVNTICGIMNYPMEKVQFVEDRKGHDYRYAINSSHIFSELGWMNRTSLESGLRKTIDWYTQNQEWVKKCKSLV